MGQVTMNLRTSCDWTHVNADIVIVAARCTRNAKAGVQFLVSALYGGCIVMVACDPVTITESVQS